MNFVFWQNMVSIHQSALMSALSSKHSVTLVVEQIFEQERVSSGWGVPQMGATSIIEAPTEQEIDELLSSKDDRIHIFTGMRAYPMVTRAFKLAIKRRLRIGLYMEPYDPTGWMGILRKCVYRFLTLRYRNSISFVLATGNTGVQCYMDAGFSSQQVFEWGYFTESSSHCNIVQSNSDKTRLLYIGQLIERKRILPFIEIFKSLYNTFSCELHIIGDGVHKKDLLEAIDGHSNINYLGNVPNEEISKHLLRADLLVLPSIHDGWGAVVNEALQSGCRVLCSTACGAASLLDGGERGGTFDWKIPNDLLFQLKTWMRKGKITPAERLDIQNWAKRNISGEAAVDYLEKIVRFSIEQNELETPSAPWKNN